MTSLGTFGAAVREFDPGSERDTFDFFDETFTVEGVIPPMLTLQLGAAITGSIRDTEGRAAMWQAMRSALTTPARGTGDGATPADDTQFDRFYELAVANRCDLTELMRLVFHISAAQAGRPTEQRPTSQPGPLPTSLSSNSPASPTPDSPVFRSVDEVLAG